MSHIHLPDGIISPVWWISGFIITFCIVYFIMKNIDYKNARQKILHTGIAVAIILLGMSVPLFIIPVHLSLAVLTGIFIGPKLGFLAVLAANFILVFIGHGGITLVGINTLIFGVEVLVGYCIFRALAKRGNYTIGTMVATATALIISMSMTIGFIGATVGLTEALPNHYDEYSYYEENGLLEEDNLIEEEGLFEEDNLIEEESSPEEQGLFEEDHLFDEERLFDEENLFGEERLLDDDGLFDEEHLLEEERLFNDERLLEQKQLLEEGRLLEDEHLLDEERLPNEDNMADEGHHYGDIIEAVKETKYFALMGWTAVLSIFVVGILLESIGTALIISCFIKVRPEIVAGIDNTNQKDRREG